MTLEIMKESLGSYSVILFGRDSEKSIGDVLFSLVNQTKRPNRIVIINDGSTDNTEQIIENYALEYNHLINIINTGSKTRDISRLPHLWNIGIEYLKGHNDNSEYHMILPSDAVLTKHYCEHLINRMIENNIVIASGDWGVKNSEAPIGGGRLIQNDFFNENYPDGYPEILGYESEILETAIANGEKIKCYNDIELFHTDKLGHDHNFKEFGYGMKCLGYYKPYVLARFLSDLFTNKNMGKSGAVKMLYYYLVFKPSPSGYYSLYPEHIRERTRLRQKDMLHRKLKRIPKGIIWRFYRHIK